EMGNPFEEESQDLLILDSKDIAGPAAVETVMNAKKIGQEQFEAFTRECLLDRTKAVDDPIPRNKLKVFSTSTPRSKSKGQQQLISVKNTMISSQECTLAAKQGMETLRNFSSPMGETYSLVPRVI
ncbi:Hypothetical protein FKW44_017958, partial [Caligus rogercresseyi]